MAVLVTTTSVTDILLPQRSHQWVLDLASTYPTLFYNSLTHHFNVYIYLYIGRRGRRGTVSDCKHDGCGFDFHYKEICIHHS